MKGKKQSKQTLTGQHNVTFTINVKSVVMTPSVLQVQKHFHRSTPPPINIIITAQIGWNGLKLNMDPKGTGRLPSFNHPVFKRTLYPTAYMRYRDIYFSITAQRSV